MERLPKKKAYLVVSVIAGLLLMLTGVQLLAPRSPSAQDKFLDQLSIALSRTPYEIETYLRHAQASGGYDRNETRMMMAVEMSEIVSRLSNMTVNLSLDHGSRQCYTGETPGNTHEWSSDYFVCFQDGQMVNYIRSSGPNYWQWHEPDHPFDIGRSLIIDQDDLIECRTGSDCTEVWRGVCGEHCTAAINVKYWFVWGWIHLVEDACLPATDCFDLERNLAPRGEVLCVRGKCERRFLE